MGTRGGVHWDLACGWRMADGGDQQVLRVSDEARWSLPAVAGPVASDVRCSTGLDGEC